MIDDVVYRGVANGHLPRGWADVPWRDLGICEVAVPRVRCACGNDTSGWGVAPVSKVKDVVLDAAIGSWRLGRCPRCGKGYGMQVKERDTV
jgi:hypothetical protein